MPRYFRVFSFTAAVFIVAFAPLWLRSVYESSQSLKGAEFAYADGDRKAAIGGFAESIRWRGIGNWYAKKAETRLRELIPSFDDQHKQYALESLRSALLVSRSPLRPFNPREGEIRELEQQLEALGARRTESYPKPEIYRIDYPRLIIIQTAFWGWIVSMFLFISRGFTSSGSVVVPEFKSRLRIALGFLVLWLTTLAL